MSPTYARIYEVVRRIPRGRVATPAAWAHLGLTPPDPLTPRGPGAGLGQRTGSARSGGNLFDTGA